MIESMIACMMYTVLLFLIVLIVLLVLWIAGRDMLKGCRDTDASMFDVTTHAVFNSSIKK